MRISFARLIPIGLALLAATPTSFARDARLTHGPLAAAVTADSAKVWIRTSAPASVQIRYAPCGDPSASLLSDAAQTNQARDFTAAIPLRGLAAGTPYCYLPLIDGTPMDGAAARFQTAPPDGAAASLTMGILTDLLSDEPAPAMAALGRENPDFVIILGDYDHRNPDRLPAMRAMHREVRAEAASGADLREHVLRRFAVTHVWDDHDYARNNADKRFSRKREALQAFDEYWPTHDRPNPEAGLWHRFRWGSLAEVFMLDLRSQRDAASDPDDGNKSMLDGDRIAGGQKEWLKDALLASPAKWKFIASTVPWNPTVRKKDAWRGYRAEQAALLRFMTEHGVTGVIVISGDIHLGGAIDDGANAGLPELNAPGTNMGRRKMTCGRGCGSWSHGWSPEASGYGLIRVTADQVTLEARSADGQLRTGLSLPTP